MKKKIILNSKKQVIVTILNDKHGKYVGKAKCNPEDDFSIEDGEFISLQRAKIKRLNKNVNLIKKILNKYKNMIANLEKVINEKETNANIIQNKLDEYLKNV